MEWPDLLDAAGTAIPVDTCWCGRPKLTHWERCCAGCEASAFGEVGTSIHSTACNMRCATLGVPGFGVRCSDVHEHGSDFMRIVTRAPDSFTRYERRKQKKAGR